MSDLVYEPEPQTEPMPRVIHRDLADLIDYLNERHRDAPFETRVFIRELLEFLYGE